MRDNGENGDRKGTGLFLMWLIFKPLYEVLTDKSKIILFAEFFYAWCRIGIDLARVTGPLC